MRLAPLIALALVTACHAQRTETACAALSSPTAVAQVVTAQPVVGPQVVAGASDYLPGQPIDLLFQGRWYAGTVVEVIRRDRWEVAYDGYGPDWNRLVCPEQLRPRQAQAVAAQVEPPGRPVLTAMELQPGMPVLVEHGGTWYEAHVIQTTQEGQARITYDGYASNWDETVPLSRLRHRPQG